MTAAMLNPQSILREYPVDSSPTITRRFPSDHIPRGWYQIGWSGEFELGRILSMRYFERDLIGFRGESGTVHVLDAFCRHLGAHLGYGGCIEGDSVRCPYHGWLWAADGTNEEIPYSDPSRMENLRLDHWETREVDGMVLAHHAPKGESPGAAPETFVKNGSEVWPVYPAATRLWKGLAMCPQVVADNVPDAEHFKYVHRTEGGAELTGVEEDGDTFRAHFNIRYGAGYDATWATPLGPVDGDATSETYGLGISCNRLGGFDEVYSSLGTTPITPYQSDVRLTVWVPRRRGNGTELSEEVRDLWVKQQVAQVEADLKVWTNQTFVERPPWTKSESESMRVFRRWSKRFYPD